jgi:hypothetical protein
VISQVTSRLGLAVTDPLDEEQDGRLGITLVDGWTAKPEMAMA